MEIWWILSHILLLNLHLSWGVSVLWLFLFIKKTILKGPILIGSSKGGVNIEEVAATDPDAIIKIPIDINQGVTQAQVNDMVNRMGFHDQCKVWNNID